ncbi:hypothetical protein BDR26DRAFT_638729 [Obelidium mucronatum]|nr:hypothetical protein BDR26DRAFT_638729 [Obelidium mucronatum]
MAESSKKRKPEDEPACEKAAREALNERILESLRIKKGETVYSFPEPAVKKLVNQFNLFTLDNITESEMRKWKDNSDVKKERKRKENRPTLTGTSIEEILNKKLDSNIIMDIHQLDVGAGDCALIRIRDTKLDKTYAIMIDGGPRDLGLDLVVANCFDWICVTHYDDDHWRGFKTLMTEKIVDKGEIKFNCIDPGQPIYDAHETNEFFFGTNAATKPEQGLSDAGLNSKYLAKNRLLGVTSPLVKKAGDTFPKVEANIKESTPIKADVHIGRNLLCTNVKKLNDSITDNLTKELKVLSGVWDFKSFPAVVVVAMNSYVIKSNSSIKFAGAEWSGVGENPYAEFVHSTTAKVTSSDAKNRRSLGLLIAVQPNETGVPVYFLTCGDLVKDVEKQLWANLAKHKIFPQILKISHHGSDSSTPEPKNGETNFFQELKHIFNSHGNRHYHPDAGVLERLQRMEQNFSVWLTNPIPGCTNDLVSAWNKRNGTSRPQFFIAGIRTEGKELGHIAAKVKESGDIQVSSPGNTEPKIWCSGYGFTEISDVNQHGDGVFKVTSFERKGTTTGWYQSAVGTIQVTINTVKHEFNWKCLFGPNISRWNLVLNSEQPITLDQIPGVLANLPIDRPQLPDELLNAAFRQIFRESFVRDTVINVTAFSLELKSPSSSKFTSLSNCIETYEFIKECSWTGGQITCGFEFAKWGTIFQFFYNKAVECTLVFSDKELTVFQIGLARTQTQTETNKTDSSNDNSARDFNPPDTPFLNIFALKSAFFTVSRYGESWSYGVAVELTNVFKINEFYVADLAGDILVNGDSLITSATLSAKIKCGQNTDTTGELGYNNGTWYLDVEYAAAIRHDIPGVTLDAVHTFLSYGGNKWTASVSADCSLDLRKDVLTLGQLSAFGRAQLTLFNNQYSFNCLGLFKFDADSWVLDAEIYFSYESSTKAISIQAPNIEFMKKNLTNIGGLKIEPQWRIAAKNLLYTQIANVSHLSFSIMIAKPGILTVRGNFAFETGRKTLLEVNIAVYDLEFRTLFSVPTWLSPVLECLKKLMKNAELAVKLEGGELVYIKCSKLVCSNAKLELLYYSDSYAQTKEREEEKTIRLKSTSNEGCDVASLLRYFLDDEIMPDIGLQVFLKEAQVSLTPTRFNISGHLKFQKNNVWDFLKLVGTVIDMVAEFPDPWNIAVHACSSTLCGNDKSHQVIFESGLKIDENRVDLTGKFQFYCYQESANGKGQSILWLTARIGASLNFNSPALTLGAGVEGAGDGVCLGSILGNNFNWISLGYAEIEAKMGRKTGFSFQFSAVIHLDLRASNESCKARDERNQSSISIRSIDWMDDILNINHLYLLLKLTVSKVGLEVLQSQMKFKEFTKTIKHAKAPRLEDSAFLALIKFKSDAEMVCKEGNTGVVVSTHGAILGDTVEIAGYLLLGKETCASLKAEG